MFTTGSRINALTVHTQISSQKGLKVVLCAENDRDYKKKGALNSNVTSDFKPEVVILSELRMCS